MLGLHRNLLAGAAGLALTVGGISGAIADPLILAPNAMNNGGGQITATPISPFSTVGGLFNFGSDLVIQSTLGASASTEVGSLYFTGLDVSPAVSGLGVDYNLIATYTITGDGSWAGNVYSLTSNVDVDITLYAVPNGTLPITTGTPNVGTSTYGLSTVGAIELGSLSLDPSITDSATATNGLNGTGTTGLNILLSPDLLPAFTGSNGFFQNVVGSGLNLSLTTSDSSQTDETVVSSLAAGQDGCTNAAGCTDFQSNYQTQFAGPNGSIGFDVPEPGSLALLGSALLAFGAIRLRRNRNA